MVSRDSLLMRLPVGMTPAALAGLLRPLLEAAQTLAPMILLMLSWCAIQVNEDSCCLL